MTRIIGYLSFSLIFLFIGCTKESRKDNTTSISGEEIKIEWKLKTNAYNGRDDRYLQEVTIINKGQQTLPASGWAIYFSAPPSPLDTNLTDIIMVTQIQGDLFKISPTSKFKPVGPNESFNFQFAKNGAFCIKYTDAPCGFYIVDSNEVASNIKDLTYSPLITKDQTTRGSGDVMPVIDAELLYNNNSKLVPIADESYSRIVPTPVKYTSNNSEEVVLSASSSIYYSNGLKDEAEYLKSSIQLTHGLTMNITLLENNNLDTKGNILLTLNPDELKFGPIPSPEGYHLHSFLGNLIVKGKSKTGVLYGVQSLRQSLPAIDDEKIIVSGLSVIDYPRFNYRGMHLDAGRNFHSKKAVLKLLEVMSYYKLNKFHFHLTDDEGWRIQIAGLPELTDVGSKRGHTTTERDMLQPAYGSGGDPDAESNNGSGYYSREDFIEILKYAKLRKIEVIPEIDLPGHSRAAIKSMEARYFKYKDSNIDKAEQYLLSDLNDESVYRSVQSYNDNVICPCQQSTYDFMAVVFDDMISMYKEADATFTTMHVGGDEVPGGVWEKSPKCTALQSQEGLNGPVDISRHFLRKLSVMLKERNLVLAGWEETACDRIELDNGGHSYEPNPEFANGHFMPYVWNNVWGWGGESRAYELANTGYKVVLCNATNLYFDLAYNKNPEEPGYYWAGFGNVRTAYEFTPMNIYNSAYVDRMGNEIDPNNYATSEQLSKVGLSNIQGMQGHLWSENIKGIDSLEYFYMPKLIGVAERAWSKQPSWEMKRNLKALEMDWNIFAQSLGKYQFASLDKLAGGINYRIPPVGIKLENSTVYANIEYPGFDIRYTNDGTTPTPSSSLYSTPLPESKVMKFRAFNTLGRGGRVTEK